LIPTAQIAIRASWMTPDSTSMPALTQEAFRQAVAYAFLGACEIEQPLRRVREQMEIPE